MEHIGILLLIWFVAVSILMAFYSRQLFLLWLEPVLHCPVLIFESDDWGPGPDEQVNSLKQIISILEKHHDVSGRQPVMTLGMTLAIPDAGKVKEQDCSQYYRITLEEECFTDLRRVLRDGYDKGIFDLHLHGMEHYWPDAVLSVARKSQAICTWMTSGNDIRTEDLPAHLQSRWSDGSQLPSSKITSDRIDREVAREVDCFTDIFGKAPDIVVPPTFDWSEEVEQAWASRSVKVIMTPGKRFEGRDSNGNLVAVPGMIVNGMRSISGATYIVRDKYFEPSFGHKTEDGIAAIESNTYLGRPTLLETHRFNFLGPQSDNSIHAMDDLLSRACNEFSNIKFMNVSELIGVMREGNTDFIMKGFRERLITWARRVRTVTGFWRIARYTGLAIVFNVIGRSTVNVYQ